MLTVGLTGCRFSGKTMVGKLFKQVGVPVFNSDVILKFILNFRISSDAYIKNAFGEDVFKNGFLDIDRFDNDEDFNKLIDIAEFELFQTWETFKDKNKNAAYIIFESSIIYERNYKSKFEAIISVFAPIQDRVYRCKQDTGIMSEYAWDMFSKEVSEIDKNQISNYIIHNYESASDILTQVNNIDKEIIDIVLKKDTSNLSISRLLF